MKKSATVEEWEIIAKQTLANPKASRSECLAALVGINQSKNEWLREQLAKQLKVAWTANLNAPK